MRIFDLYESTVAGAIATVESPLGGVQKRNPGVKVKGLEPADKVMFGKSKKSGPYKNSLSESRVKQLLDDLKEFMLMSALKNIKVKQRIFCEQTI